MPCRLDERQIAVLVSELGRGPTAHGWQDQRWTLARISTLIAELTGVSYTLRGTSYLLHRIGWSPQVPTRRAVERDHEEITAWRKETWPRVKARPPSGRRGSASRTSRGQGLRPPK
ncbi:helix-turn-helix domain-containing protein [Acrocarpospora corrugata]|uniref:helix-turn-helix domain-containing protein n=1 Tax=Acrocarpospora corrugata TaxID=35763 RepID=UPI001FE85B91|nr:winged helix-turn-helix domain-containing protein [Acrocarpospora corrugata]